MTHWKVVCAQCLLDFSDCRCREPGAFARVATDQAPVDFALIGRLMLELPDSSQIHFCDGEWNIQKPGYSGAYHPTLLAMRIDRTARDERPK